VTIIDWEYATVGPRHQDMVRLIVDVKDHAAAYAGWRLLVDSVPRKERPSLAILLRWLTLRTYCSEVAVPHREINPSKCAHRRKRWIDARLWADEVAPVHRKVS
jgi:hypothetical protein